MNLLYLFLFYLINSIKYKASLTSPIKKTITMTVFFTYSQDGTNSIFLRLISMITLYHACLKKMSPIFKLITPL